MAESAGRDPRVRDLAFTILREAGVDQREYEKQARALLVWVQQNIAYVNEPGEILQDPLYTLRQKAGDCDDMSSLLMALYESIALPWRYVLSGRTKDGTAVRWIEGEGSPPNIVWSHIYGRVGWPPFKPTTWAFTEPTMKSATLGWDVVDRNSQAGGAGAAGPLGLGGWFPTLPSPYGSPFGAFALTRQNPPAAGGSAIAAVAGGAGAGAAMGQQSKILRIDLQAVVAAVVVGVVTSVLAQILLDEIRVRRGRKG
jgi:hypothetical protein